MVPPAELLPAGFDQDLPLRIDDAKRNATDVPQAVKHLLENRQVKNISQVFVHRLLNKLPETTHSGTDLNEIGKEWLRNYILIVPDHRLFVASTRHYCMVVNRPGQRQAELRAATTA